MDLSHGNMVDAAHSGQDLHRDFDSAGILRAVAGEYIYVCACFIHLLIIVASESASSRRAHVVFSLVSRTNRCCRVSSIFSFT